MQRTEFVDATLRVIAREGLGAFTARAVAAEAGWSVGALQKSFPSMDELIRAAVARTIDAADARIAAVPQTGSLIEYLVAVVEETLPLDGRRRDEAKVWAALTTRAADVPWMAQVFIEQDEKVVGELSAALAGAQSAGLVPGGGGPDALAGVVVALSDGLAGRLLYDPAAELAVRSALRVGIEKLLS